MDFPQILFAASPQIKRLIAYVSSRKLDNGCSRGSWYHQMHLHEPFTYTKSFLEVQRAYNSGTNPKWICSVIDKIQYLNPNGSPIVILWKCTSTPTQMKHTTIALHTNGISS